MEQLGKARKVIATKEHTTIVDGQGDKTAIDGRVAQMRATIKESNSEFDKEKLMERIARLAGGIGVIKVGAFTETEMKAKKFKIEDALNATRAAVEEGIVAGGGSALAKIAPILEEAITNSPYFQENEKRGASIVRKSLEAPFRQIAENAGAEASAILAFVQKAEGHAGYDFANYDEMNWQSGKKDDMIAAGIVDPVKVTRLALENAVSIASTLVTTETIIVDKPEPKADSAAGMGGGMPGGMGGMGF